MNRNEELAGIVAPLLVIGAVGLAWIVSYGPAVLGAWLVMP